MIRSFKHKGLDEFFRTGSKKGIIVEHAAKLARILDRLDASQSPFDMALPGFNLHELHGNLKGTFAVKVSGNWRVTFQFRNGGAELVDYQDYH